MSSQTLHKKSSKKRGILFEQGLNEFIDFVEGNPIWIFDGDYGVLKQNCEIAGIPFPFIEKSFTRVKKLLPKWGINSSLYSSGTLHKAVGITLKGHVHNALHDVRSMAAAVYKLTA